MVPVPDRLALRRAVEQLIADESVTLIELCGGMDAATVAGVVEIAAGRAAVGHVTFGADSIVTAAAYVNSAVTAQGEPTS